MKHDFNHPIEDVIPHVAGLPCDCVDCVKHTAYTKQLSDRNAVYANSFDLPSFDRHGRSAMNLVDHADDGTAADYIGADLWAVSPVTVYSDKGVKVARTVAKGQKIGTVYSWITTPPMFMLDDNTFVKIETGKFDKDKAISSLATKKAADKKAVDAKVQERLTANDNPLYLAGKKAQAITENVGDLLSGFGTYTKITIAVLVIAVIAAVFFRIKG